MDNNHDNSTQNPQGEKKNGNPRYGHRPNYHRPKPQYSNDTENGSAISMRPGRYDKPSESETHTEIIPTPANAVSSGNAVNTADGKASPKPYNRNGNRNRYRNDYRGENRNFNRSTADTPNTPVSANDTASTTPAEQTAAPSRDNNNTKPRYSNTRRPPKYNNRVPMPREAQSADAAKSESAKNDAATKSEYTKNDVAKPEYAKNDASKPEYAKNDAAKSDYTKNDAAKSDYANNRKRPNYPHNDAPFKKRNNGYPHPHKHTGNREQKNFDPMNTAGLSAENAEDTADISRPVTENVKNEVPVRSEFTLTAGYDESALTDEKIAEELKKEYEAVSSDENKIFGTKKASQTDAFTTDTVNAASNTAVSDNTTSNTAVSDGITAADKADTDTIPAVFDISTVRIASKPRPAKNYYIPTVGVGVQATGILPPDIPNDNAGDDAKSDETVISHVPKAADTDDLAKAVLKTSAVGTNEGSDTAKAAGTTEVSDTAKAAGTTEVSDTANAAGMTEAADTTEVSDTANAAGTTEAADTTEVSDTTETTKPTADKPSENEPVPKVVIIGVRFKSTGKIYYFDPEGVTFKRGDAVIVDTARGIEYGIVDISNRPVNASEVVMPLRKVVRRATAEDAEHAQVNIVKAAEAMTICAQKIIDHKLEMKLVDVEYAFDNSKLLFYFTADGRVDFRELVKDLASVFRTRIELRQIGIRDETKLLGGIGICGRPFCCKSFLSDFVQVSIKMAKEQNLSLNSLKISGACGRLMCCLRYEYDAYVEEISRTPKVEQTVSTPDGDAVVTEVQPLAGLCRVRFLNDPEAPMKVYHRDQLAVIEK